MKLLTLFLSLHIFLCQKISSYENLYSSMFQRNEIFSVFFLLYKMQWESALNKDQVFTKGPKM